MHKTSGGALRAAWPGRLLTAVLCLVMAGCASLAPDIKAPQLAVVNVGMVSADIFSQQFRVRLHVQNPNDRAIPVKAIEYELFLEGDSFAEGTSAEAFVVPALGEHEFDMSVRTNFVSSIGRLLSRMNGRDGSRISYALAGKVQVDLPFVKAIPFRNTGSVDLATLR